MITTYDFKLRPFTTTAELALSSVARLLGVKEADFYLELLPQNEVEGLSLFEHRRLENDHAKTDLLWINRLHVVFSRKPQIAYR